MRANDWRNAMILAWTERDLQGHVIRLAKTLGWMCYHTHDSRRSEPGFPDLVLVHPNHGVLWRELKTETGRASPGQARWLHALIDADQDAGIWRPRHWADGTIRDQLTDPTRHRIAPDAPESVPERPAGVQVGVNAGDSLRGSQKRAQGRAG